MVVHNVAKNHCVKQYIHVGYLVISMKYISVSDALKGKVVYPDNYKVDGSD